MDNYADDVASIHLANMEKHIKAGNIIYWGKKKKKYSGGSSSSRRSRPEVFCKKSVLINFAKFTGKHLFQKLFFDKVECLRPFPVNFAKFLRTSFIIEHVLWLFSSSTSNLQINLSWNWLILLYIVFTKSVIQLPPRKDAQCGFDVFKCYQK